MAWCHIWDKGGWLCLSLVPQFEGKWSILSLVGHTVRREDGVLFQLWVTTFELRGNQFVTMSVPLR